MRKQVIHIRSIPRSFVERALRDWYDECAFADDSPAKNVCGYKRGPYVLREPSAKGFANLRLTKEEQKRFRWCKRCLAGGKRLVRR